MWPGTIVFVRLPRLMMNLWQVLPQVLERSENCDGVAVSLLHLRECQQRLGDVARTVRPAGHLPESFLHPGCHFLGRRQVAVAQVWGQVVVDDHHLLEPDVGAVGGIRIPLQTPDHIEMCVVGLSHQRLGDVARTVRPLGHLPEGSLDPG